MGVIRVVDDFGNVTYEDDGMGEAPIDTTKSTTSQADPNFGTKIRNRTYSLRKAYWRHLYRLPTQAEFDRYALRAPGVLVSDADFNDVLEKTVPALPASTLAKNEHGEKENSTTVPPGEDFGTSEDYDPRAPRLGTSTGTGTGGGGGGGNNTQFFDADGKWIGGTNYQAYFESLFPGGTITKEELRAKAAELTRAGISIHTNTGGDVIKLPDGSLIDVIRDVGGANGRIWNSASGNTPPPPPPGGTGSMSTETPAQRTARLAGLGLGPEGLQNQRPGEMPPQPTMGDMMGQQGPIADPGTYTPGEAYNAPDYMAPAPFAAPTAADMGQDPGYQFRLTEGQKALERSGAARGVTNTGGNMKGLLDYGQRAASQEYGNVYDRSLNTYNTNAENAFRQYSTTALKNNAFNTETEGRRSGAFGTNTNLYQQQQTDAYNRRQKAYDDSVAAYQMRTSNQRNFERDRASDLFRVAGI